MMFQNIFQKNVILIFQRLGACSKLCGQLRERKGEGGRKGEGEEGELTLKRGVEKVEFLRPRSSWTGPTCRLSLTENIFFTQR